MLYWNTAVQVLLAHPSSLSHSYYFSVSVSLADEKASCGKAQNSLFSGIMSVPSGLQNVQNPPQTRQLALIFFLTDWKFSTAMSFFSSVEKHDSCWPRSPLVPLHSSFLPSQSTVSLAFQQPACWENELLFLSSPWGTGGMGEYTTIQKYHHILSIFGNVVVFLKQKLEFCLQMKWNGFHPG